MTDLKAVYDAPWKLTPGKTGVTGKSGEILATVFCVSKDYQPLPVERTASLIAAAPLLLLAAEAALEHLSNTLNGDPHDPAIVAWNILAEAIAAARG